MLTHVKEDNPDGQVPDNNWTIAPDESRLAPTLLSVMEILDVDDKVNLYHTSSSGVPVHVPMGTPVLAVACLTVPPVAATFSDNAIAPAQSSFDGGAVIA